MAHHGHYQRQRAKDEEATAEEAAKDEVYGLDGGGHGVHGKVHRQTGDRGAVDADDADDVQWEAQPEGDVEEDGFQLTQEWFKKVFRNGNTYCVSTQGQRVKDVQQNQQHYHQNEEDIDGGEEDFSTAVTVWRFWR